MGSKMLIDAIHAEETRVVVARGTRIEEFDFESASRKPLKGNIYLAKVTRVEPSLQAAFVEYGGNRHGFLAFAEIHPDYYQIPIADRLALIKEQEEEDAAEAEEESLNGDNHAVDDGEHENGSAAESENGQSAEANEFDAGESDADSDSESATVSMALEASDSLLRSEVPSPGEVDAVEPAPTEQVNEVESVDTDVESQQVESVGAEDALEEVPRRQRRPQRRRYKIQEVIKRRQILLVQVVKEERGNKGAALTTYLSLAGRYCVLMPNTARGGGISRKITDNNDRRRLKEVARDIEIPQGMGLIVRTAGAQRTRPEIKRDFDYLIRLWESVRTLTLESTAPSLVYEEGSLIKRSIRDLYTKDVDEVVVEGEEAYREAKDFMKMLMPSHAKNVRLYKESRPLFAAHHIENQLDALFSPTVTLPSGGYLVINQTEALVSIDINSGKSTREHSIEETALRTNIEACDEIARQLRLRDLAGLVVIDFIDMDENRNNRTVERRIKEALKNDRARIQVGRISHFGLLEMSRQRLRPGLIEGTFRTCPHCEGRGMVRSVPSCGLGILRTIEEQLQKRAESLNVKCAPEVAYYLLNEKRDSLLNIEQAYSVNVFIIPASDVKDTLAQIERVPTRMHHPRKISTSPVQIDSAFDDMPSEEELVPAEETVEETDESVAEQDSGEREATSADDEQSSRNGRRRRRRGRRGRGNRPEGAEPGARSEEHRRNRPTEPAEEAQFDGEQGDDARPLESAPESENQATDDQSEQAEEGAEGAPRERRRPRDRNRRSRGNGHRNEGQSGNRDGGRERRPREERPEAQPSAAEARTVPAPIQIDIPETVSDPQPRKWQPPAPTVSVEPAERKAGWWSKRK